MSDRFTIEDIHEIRRENYEKTKSFSHAQLLEQTKEDAAEGLKIMESLKLVRKNA